MYTQSCISACIGTNTEQIARALRITTVTLLHTSS